MRMFAALLTCATACAVPVFAAINGDARRGAEFVEKQKCKTCHSMGAAMKGGNRAPDLAASTDREYTPSGIASRMWNHAPGMWAEISKEGMPLPAVTDQDAADLFAFFYQARYFEKAGDAGRGKRAFAEKHCADCHSLTAEAGPQVGPPVSKWQSLRDPVALVQRMWNHLPEMKTETAKRKMSWPELTPQDLTDMHVYLRTLPGMNRIQGDFAMSDGSNGAQILESKGCANCHKGSMSLEKRLSNQTLTGIATEMWNHGPRMKQPGMTLTEDEMRQLLAYLWGNQFFAPHGNAARGKRVFESNQCGMCHGQGAAAKITGNPQFSDIMLVSALWKHGPRMLATLKQKEMVWPKFTPGQVSDLVAYLAKPE